jgi:hypothetical protein
LVGRKVSLLDLEDAVLPKPNHKALEIMQKIEEQAKGSADHRRRIKR